MNPAYFCGSFQEPPLLPDTVWSASSLQLFAKLELTSSQPQAFLYLSLFSSKHLLGCTFGFFFFFKLIDQNQLLGTQAL